MSRFKTDNMYSSEQLRSIAIRLRDKVFANISTYKTTLFLCGASVKNRKSKRYKIDKLLNNLWYSFRYEFFYPEDLFDELISGSGSYNLLNLENILAESIDVIIIVPESYGAAAELGAFVNNESLRNKIVCIQDIEHKKTKSFINYGPIRLLKKTKSGKVIYVDFNKLIFESKKITSAIKHVSKTSPTRFSFKPSNIGNIIHTEKFILPCIYLMEPIPRQMITDLIKYAAECDDEKANASTAAALRILINNKLIVATSDGYRLTQLGLKNFINLGKYRTSKSYFNNIIMDQIRFDILSWRCRNRKFKFINV